MRDVDELGYDPTDPAFERRWRVRGLMGLNRLYGRGFHRLSVLNRPDVPAVGPVLIAANHASGLDPMLIQTVVTRPIAWMVTSEYFDLPGLRTLFRRTGCIRVDREKVDSASVKQALRTLRGGRVVGIFPEGRIERTSRLLELRPGAGRLAMQAGCPVLPAWVDGDMRPRPGEDSSVSDVCLKPRRAAVAFGPLMPPPARRGGGDFEAELAAELGRLRGLTRRAVGERRP